MYEAVRPRAPSSTKIVGASTAVLITALMGYALTSGLAIDIVRAIQTETVMARLPPPPKKPPETAETFKVEDLSSLYVPPVIQDLPVFDIDKPSPITGVAGPAPGPGAGSGSGSLVKAAVAAPVRVTPKLVSPDEPVYPPASRREHEEGTTGLEVCVGVNGRVTSASVATSSGFARLDDAALTWVKRARFRPGTVGGTPQAMCGHRIFYEWHFELLCVDENARRDEDKLKPCPSKVR